MFRGIACPFLGQGFGHCFEVPILRATWRQTCSPSWERLFGKNARLPHHGAWLIYDWHGHQPTQDQLNALHLRDVTPNQAREVDRLYNQLESSSSRILKQEPALVH